MRTRHAGQIVIEAFDSLDGVQGATVAPALEAGPLIRLISRGGRPRAASGLVLVRAPADVLWQFVSDIDRFPKLINMVHSVRHLPPTPEGVDVVRVNLRFKVTFFSTKFDFVATQRTIEKRRVELHYLRGKVRDVAIELEVLGVSDDRSILRCHVGFDPRSLGWLVKIFLRHHPEIEVGLHVGSVMSITSSACEAAEKQSGARQ